ncbi:unnamed protein product [Adineta steineri]|uniref:Protein kinase domain-containing protein n=1 Tax=Adineta steineri TaxID=433720 RepID=A0A814MRK8_9BILA|nr:unnamed protein product [Adineta steineri]
MDPVTILKNVCQTALTIREIVKDVKANQQQCKRLSQRIDAINSALKAMTDKDLQRNELQKSLNNYWRCIEYCCGFVTQFRDEKSWFSKIFDKQNDKEKFQEFNRRLTECATDLNLGINLKQIFDRKLDMSDQATDLDVIKSKRDEVAKLMTQKQHEELRFMERMEQNTNQLHNSFKHTLEQCILKRSEPLKAQTIAEEEHAFLHIPYYDLVLEKRIGQGEFADVYRGKWLPHDHKVAIKVFRIQYIDATVKRGIVNEISIMQRIHYDHVLNIYGACMEPDKYALIVEYMSLGSLYDILRRQVKQFSWSDRYSIATQMVKGVNYLHNLPKPIIHRDIKSLNILITEQGKDFLVKVADFGLAKICHETSRQSSYAPLVGALPWKAPELFTIHGNHTKASDVYAMGVVLWELATGCEPYANTDVSMISTDAACVELEIITSPHTTGQSSLVNHININIKWKQHGVTIAGENGYGNQLSQLSRPQGIYVDDDHQTIYIADFGNDRIVEWKYGAKNGQVVVGRNGKGNRSDQLHWPTDVIVEKINDSLIICDYKNRRVVRWSRQNGDNGETIISDIDCYGLTIDKNSDLYVSDYVKNEVRRWKQGEKEGTIVAGGNGKGKHLNQLHCPTHIFVDKDHSTYVSDSFNNRVMKWMKGAKEGIVVASGKDEGNSLTQLSYPWGVVVDHLGNVYVADSNNHRIMRWCEGSCEGSIVVGGNEEGEQPNQFNYPRGLSFDVQGNLYVVDYWNHRIQKFDIDSELNLYEDLGKLASHMNDYDMSIQRRQKSLVVKEQNQLTTNSNIGEAKNLMGKFIKR